jgi:hypothetical protein
MLTREPVFDRILIQKTGDVVDFAVRAVTNNMPFGIGSLLGLENDGR